MKKRPHPAAGHLRAEGRNSSHYDAASLNHSGRRRFYTSSLGCR